MTTDDLKKIAETGIKKLKTDGTETEFQSLSEINKQIRKGDPTANRRRPFISTINLSGA
ncbi:hypothetical protein KOR42_33050 [Thalassoglobus neptunius]|uniref:Uncharacterized protein n=1 Tax=Thalassoglobus neptunius TaxID=1938619 RepID=A0A5C5WPU7_9PLAN|nr:hypothetical protein [Thalassoglobus neptunius]TWT51832.1 hypothetical protein KOR42_33050 [Thalassoglobus neptunius]